MSFEIRAATVSDEPLLWQMLYLTVYVPHGEPALPPSVVSQPALARYVRNWGKAIGGLRSCRICHAADF